MSLFSWWAGWPHVTQQGNPPPPPPAPAPAPAPPTPVPPAPVPIPAAPSKLVQWLKDAVTITGAIATFATAIHQLIGQFLQGADSVAVPAGIALITTAFSAHTVRTKNLAVKAAQP